MTSALARRNSGVQAGSVDGATSTAPAGMASPAAGSRATKAGPRAWPAATGVPRHLSAPGSIPASARAQGRPARRRRFPPPRPDLPRPPIVAAVSCATRRRAAAAGSAPSARPAIPRRSGGTHRRARPGRRAGAAFAQRQRAAPGGGDVADQHAARGLALAAVQPRAGDQQPRQRPLPARAAPRSASARPQARRPPGAHAARPGRRRSGSARCPADNPALRASADDADRFRRRRDGRSAPGSPRRRGERAIWRQRVAPVRAAPVGCAQPGQRRRIVARQRGQIHQRVALGGRHAGRAASHERGGQRVALARAGRLDQFQQFRQGAAG